MDHNELTKRFSDHPATAHRAGRHEHIRSLFLTTAFALDNILIDTSYEKSACINKLEEAMFWANACLARHGERPHLEDPIQAKPFRLSTTNAPPHAPTREPENT